MRERALPPQRARLDSTRLARRIASTVGFVMLVALGSATVALTPACQDRTCEGIGMDWGRVPGQGTAIDANTWESSPADGEWLHFPGQRTYFFYPGAFARRQISRVTVYISPDPTPNGTRNDPDSPRTQYTVASGNVAVITHFPDPADKQNPAVGVRNDTCAAFYTRVVIEAYPQAPLLDAGTSDSGTLVSVVDATADVGINDASGDVITTDAPSDGAAD